MEIKINENIRFQYAYVYQYIDAVISKIGASNLFTQGKYKRYKELFLGAVVAQYFTEINNEYHFVVSPDDDPPDFMLRVLRKHEDADDKTDEISFPFEIADYTQHSPSLESVIDAKLAMNYPKHYNLVIFFRNPNETTFDYDDLRKKYEREQERWIMVIAKTNETHSGIKLPQERWLIIPLAVGNTQRMMKLDKALRPDLEPAWRQQGRGRDKIINKQDVKIKLPD